VEKPVPIYLTIQPERPSVELETLQWLYMPEQELFALSPEGLDTYNKNNSKLENYHLQLQEIIKYYENQTRAPGP
jgi:hypothetical protein